MKAGLSCIKRKSSDVQEHVFRAYTSRIPLGDA
jgi:hypothetical protein